MKLGRLARWKVNDFSHELLFFSNISHSMQKFANDIDFPDSESTCVLTRKYHRFDVYVSITPNVDWYDLEISLQPHHSQRRMRIYNQLQSAQKINDFLMELAPVSVTFRTHSEFIDRVDDIFHRSPI